MCFAGNTPVIRINLPNEPTSAASRAFAATGHPSQAQRQPYSHHNVGQTLREKYLPRRREIRALH